MVQPQAVLGHRRLLQVPPEKRPKLQAFLWKQALHLPVENRVTLLRALSKSLEKREKSSTGKTTPGT